MTNVPVVYQLRYCEGFEWLLPVDENDFDRLRFDGQPLAARWKPIGMRRLGIMDDGNQRSPSDFPCCSGREMLLLSQAAYDKLGHEFRRYGELLPLHCEDEDFWTLNVTTLIDALDESNSEVLRASDTGKILMIMVPQFQPSSLEHAGLFKLKQVPRGLIYFTQPMVDRVMACGLKGIEFVQVWPQDQRTAIRW